MQKVMTEEEEENFIYNFEHACMIVFLLFILFQFQLMKRDKLLH